MLVSGRPSFWLAGGLFVCWFCSWDEILVPVWMAGTAFSDGGEFLVWEELLPFCVAWVESNV